jgi:hypothetical protein
LRDRLQLKTAAAAGPDAKAIATIDRAAARAAVERVLASPTASRADFDVLTNSMAEIVQATTERGTAERARVANAADRALAKLAVDRTLSATDRLDAEITRVQVANLDIPVGAKAAPTSKARADEIRRVVADADRTTTDAYERQTVINAAAELLSEAGLADDSDALLVAELKRSHSPYYFMLHLASNARKRGDAARALDWYRQAYENAKGPATRLQWGSTYVRALIDLSPDDAPRIEKVASQILAEVDPAPASFEGRNRKSLVTMAAKIDVWHAAHASEATRIAERSKALCEKMPSERERCATLLKVALAKPTATPTS